MLPLAQKYFLHHKRSCRPEITKGGLQEAEGLEEEAKVASFLWLSAFPLELVPLLPLQDHRDGDAETLEAGVFCSFNQTIPSSF
jgi:hypothetical protein